MQTRVQNLKRANELASYHIKHLDELKKNFSQLTHIFPDLVSNENAKNDGIALSNFVRDLKDIQACIEGVETPAPSSKTMVGMFFEAASSVAGYAYASGGAAKPELGILRDKIKPLEELYKDIIAFQNQIIKYIEMQSSYADETAYYNLQSLRSCLLASNFDFPDLNTIHKKIETGLERTSGGIKILTPLSHARWEKKVKYIDKPQPKSQKKKHMAVILDEPVAKATMTPPIVPIEKKQEEEKKHPDLIPKSPRKSDEEWMEHHRLKALETVNAIEKERNEKAVEKRAVEEKINEEKAKHEQEKEERIKEAISARLKEESAREEARKEKARQEEYKKAELVAKYQEALRNLHEELRVILFDNVSLWHDQLSFGRSVTVNDALGNGVSVPIGIGKMHNVLDRYKPYKAGSMKNYRFFYPQNGNDSLLAQLKLMQSESDTRLSVSTRRAPITNEFYQILKDVKIDELNDIDKLKLFTAKLEKFSRKIQQQHKLKRKT